MKFLKLEILNLASLDRQEGEVVDFEHGALADSTIFSIVGPTGSGKSTLLDAICLALYNRAPRYPRKRGDRNQNIEIFGSPEDGENNRLAPTDSRNILTRGRKTGYSKLTFLANNGMVYRAEWHVRFQRVRYENARTLLYRISIKDGKQTEEPADWNALPDIIGLDYEQFLRTVLIAQGSFANFLNAKENERYELLEKLIGGEDTYSRICEKIDEHRRAAADSLKEIRAQLAAYKKDDLSEEQLAELNALIASLTERAENNRKELEGVKKALDWYERDDKYASDLKACAEDYGRARKEVDDMAQHIARLAMHDATTDAVAIYKDMKETETNIAKSTADIKQGEEQIAALQASIANENNALNALKESAQTAHDNLDKQKPHINRARAIDAELKTTLKGANEKDAAAKAAEQATAAAQMALNDNAAAIDNTEGEAKRLDEAYTALADETESKTKQLRLSADSAATAYSAEARKTEGMKPETLQEAKAEADKRFNDLKMAIRIKKELNEKKTAIQQNTAELSSLKQQGKEKEQALGNTKAAVDNLNNELNTLRHTHTLMTSADWQRHRLALHDGKPCPLCGAIHHPYATDATLAPVLSELAVLIKNKETELEGLNQNFARLTNELGSVNGSIKQIEQNMTSLEADVKRLTDEWSILHWEPRITVSRTAESHEPTLESMLSLLPLAEQQAQKAAKALKDFNSLTDNIDRLRKLKDNAAEQLNRYKEDADKRMKKAEKDKNDVQRLLATVKGQTDNLKAQLKEKKESLAACLAALNEARLATARLREEIRAEIGDKDPDKYEASLTASAKDADNKLAAKTEDIAKLNNRLGVLSGKMTADKNQLLSATTTLKRLSTELDSWIEVYNEKRKTTAPDTADITLTDIALLYSATDNWEQMRRDIQLKTDMLTRAKTLLDHAANVCKEHQQTKPATTRDDLDKRKSELAVVSDTELIEAKSRKQRYDHARRQMGLMHDRKQQAEQTANEWTAITYAIGTDGRTLRKIAQCYTLRFLIAHANAEIRKFNSRYELVQVKHSLGIRVIDHDRADDIRDTTSLSGGETFIVSLGLALGLSALSSRNISFDNLFIDEGFGTLDPDTLATVIDSLAMLQSSQGKKVGVISHTDTMSERITTQIRIIKNGNSGSSHIEVYP